MWLFHRMTWRNAPLDFQKYIYMYLSYFLIYVARQIIENFKSIQSSVDVCVRFLILLKSQPEL